MNEYLTSNEYIAFPFRDSSEGLYEFGDTPDYVTPTFPQNGITDAVITYYGGHQIYLRTIDKAGTDIEFSFGTDSGVIVIATAVLGSLVDRFVVAGRNTILEVSVKFVVGRGLYDYLSGAPDGTLDFGTSLPLTDHAMDAKPYKVTDFSVKGSTGIKGIVNFVPGYNMEIEYADDINEILFSVIPGGGEGRFNPCDEAIAEPVNYLASINGKRASDGGGMIMGGSGECYRVIATGGGFQLINDCKPCCECDDYRYFAELLRRLLDKYKEVKIKLLGAADDVYEGMIKVYNDDVVYFNGVVLPKMVGVRIYGSGRAGHTLDNDKYAYVTASFHSPGTAKSVNYTIDIQGQYEYKDGWLTVDDNTAGATEIGGFSLARNAVAVVTLLIKKKAILGPGGEIIGYHPLPGSAIVTASWSGDRGADVECPHIPQSGTTVETVTIG